MTYRLFCEHRLKGETVKEKTITNETEFNFQQHQQQNRVVVHKIAEYIQGATTIFVIPFFVLSHF